MAEDTSLLITVLMFLGFLGAIIFIPWMIYNERKKLSLKYQRIGCLISAVLLLCGMYFLRDNSNSPAYMPLDAEEANIEETPHLLELDFHREVKVKDATHIAFLLTTNCPVDTVLVVELKNFDKNKPYTSGEQSIIVGNNGNAATPEYYKADGFNEEFELCVSMFVSQQPESVKAVIGENGEFLANRFLHVEESGIVARAYYNSHLKTGYPTIEQGPTTVQDVTAPPQEETEPEATPIMAKANAQTIERALLSEIPQRYQSDSMFFTDVYVNDDNTVEFMIQLDQNSGNKDAALSLAVTYYKAAKRITEDAGGQMGRYDIMVLNNGSPVGDYVTDDGKTYSVIADGKVTSIDVS